MTPEDVESVQDFHPGDVLVCERCGYHYVNRRAAPESSCRRCGSGEVGRWKPAGES